MYIYKKESKAPGTQCLSPGKIFPAREILTFITIIK